MTRVSEVSIEIDLFRFSQWLSSQGVQHRIVEEEGAQVLYIQNKSLEEQVLQALERYIDDPSIHEQLNKWVDVNASKLDRIGSQPIVDSLYARASPKQAPVIFSLMSVCLIVAFLSNFGQTGSFIASLLILDPLNLPSDLGSSAGRWNALMATLASGDVWRVITPDFIHFSLMHITFNLLMLWVLGGAVGN